MTVLVTERLRLRPATMEDVAAFHAVLSNVEATRYWSTPPHQTLEQTRTWVEAMIASPPEDSADFVVELDGRAIGKAGFYRLPEFGFILHPDTWGRGLAREALTALFDHVLGDRGLPRAIADVDPRNARSLALLDRLGFVRTGYRERTYRLEDGWADSVDLALERTAWLERTRP